MNKAKMSSLFQTKPTYSAYPTQKRQAVVTPITTNIKTIEKKNVPGSGKVTSNSSFG